MVTFAMRIVRSLAVVFVPAILALTGGPVEKLGPQIPKQVLDWKASSPDQVFDRKTLYDYMDGGAEVYLAFGFREVFVRKYADAEENELVLDIYDMGSPAEAFGVFSCDRQDPEAGIGQGSEYGPGLLRFWRGRHFVSITVSGNEDKAEQAVLALGKAVAPLLGPDGALPEMVKLLPADGLQAAKTAYFHNHVHLSNRYFVSSENVLNLDEGTECVFAEYATEGGDSARLLVVRYPGAAAAAAAAASFLKSVLPGADADGAARTDAKGWAMIKAGGNILAAVFEARSKDYAGRLAASIVRPPK
jgi:hypothetical protein